MGVFGFIDENEADFVVAPISCSLLVRRSVTNHIAWRTVRPRLQRAGAQSPRSLSRQHAYTDPLDNRPGPVKISFPAMKQNVTCSR